MATTRDTAVDRYFQALTESYDAIIEGIKQGNERGFRVSQNLLAEAQRGQHESIELQKTWAENPTDLGGLYRAMMESTTRAQGRALELARQMFDELGETRTDARQTIEKVVAAQRSAGEAAVSAVRDVASTTAERVRTGVNRAASRTAGAVESAAGEAEETAGTAKRSTARAANSAKAE